MEARVSIVTLGVKDLERSLRFYRDGLGFPVSKASNDDVVFFRTGGIVVALFPRDHLAEDAMVPAEGSGFRGITLAHNVRDKAEVARILETAKQAGATITKSARDVFWGGHSGYFADPDGHLWEVAWNPHFPLRADGSVELP